MPTKLAPVVGLLAVLVVAAARPAVAQEAVLSQFYGSGVHQYFSGNYGQAESYLSAAIDGGTKDPRPYYFRALIGMRNGGGNAQADLQRAAALESADVNQMYPVGKALERVQGSARMQIERYRAFARAEAHQRQLRRDAARYEELKRSEGQVLRAPTRPAPAAPPVPPPGVAADDPFADDAPKPAAAPDAAADDEPAPAAKAGDDPFADQPADEGEMKEEPAADEPAMKDEEPAEEEAPAAPTPQPPKADAPDAENPFSDEGSSEEGK